MGIDTGKKPTSITISNLSKPLPSDIQETPSTSFSMEMKPAIKLKLAIEALCNSGERFGRIDVDEEGFEITVQNTESDAIAHLRLRVNEWDKFHCSKSFDPKMVDLDRLFLELDIAKDEDTVHIFHLYKSDELTFTFGDDPPKMFYRKLFEPRAEFGKCPVFNVSVALPSQHIREMTMSQDGTPQTVFVNMENRQLLGQGGLDKNSVGSMQQQIPQNSLFHPSTENSVICVHFSFKKEGPGWEVWQWSIVVDDIPQLNKELSTAFQLVEGIKEAQHIFLIPDGGPCSKLSSLLIRCKVSYNALLGNLLFVPIEYRLIPRNGYIVDAQQVQAVVIYLIFWFSMFRDESEESSSSEEEQDEEDEEDESDEEELTEEEEEEEEERRCCHIYHGRTPSLLEDIASLFLDEYDSWQRFAVEVRFYARWENKEVGMPEDEHVSPSDCWPGCRATYLGAEGIVLDWNTTPWEIAQQTLDKAEYVEALI